MQKARLEVRPNKHSASRFHCVHSCPELTALCPDTGQPDFYEVEIDYIPHKHLVELRSLKRFLQEFRNRGILHEDLLNEVFDEFLDRLQPSFLSVTLAVAVRGGISSTIKRTSGKEAQDVTGS